MWYLLMGYTFKPFLNIFSHAEKHSGLISDTVISIVVLASSLNLISAVVNQNFVHTIMPTIPHTHSHGTNDLQTKTLAKIGHNVKSTLNHCSGKNEVIQKETKALIRISNLLSKWGFPPSAKGLQKGQRREEKKKSKTAKHRTSFFCFVESYGA